MSVSACNFLNRRTAIVSTFPSLNNTWLLPGSFRAGRIVTLSILAVEAPFGLWFGLDTNYSSSEKTSETYDISALPISIEISTTVNTCPNLTVPLEFRHTPLETQVGVGLKGMELVDDYFLS